MSTLMWVCAAVAITIFGAILHSVATFRASGEPPTRYKRRALAEVGWALIPILIVVAAAAPSFRSAESPAVTVVLNGE